MEMCFCPWLASWELLGRKSLQTVRTTLRGGRCAVDDKTGEFFCQHPSNHVLVDWEIALQVDQFTVQSEDIGTVTAAEVRDLNLLRCSQKQCLLPTLMLLGLHGLCFSLHVSATENQRPAANWILFSKRICAVASSSQGIRSKLDAGSTGGHRHQKRPNHPLSAPRLVRQQAGVETHTLARRL